MTAYQLPHYFALTLHHNVLNKLDDSNWFIWTKKGTLCTVSMTEIATSTLLLFSGGRRSDCETGTAAWAALKAFFEKSTIGSCMAAHAALQSTKEKLAAYSVKFDNTEFKDVLLMHLDEAYHSIQLSIFAQSSEPDLLQIKQMLISSIATKSMITTIKSEDALATQGWNSG
ncbi:hypothetical protein C0993_006955 [Termitomyces sp. T159_Od127]|nr:hypothetical protein C0993_006955 [Termitomyces sp. T159_Od127]